MYPIGPHQPRSTPSTPSPSKQGLAGSSSRILSGIVSEDKENHTFNSLAGRLDFLPHAELPKDLNEKIIQVCHPVTSPDSKKRAREESEVVQEVVKKSKTQEVPTISPLEQKLFLILTRIRDTLFMSIEPKIKEQLIEMILLLEISSEIKDVRSAKFKLIIESRSQFYGNIYQ